MWEIKYVLSSRSIKKFSLRFRNTSEILRPNHMTIGHTCTKVKVLIQSQYTKLKVQLQIPNQYIQIIKAMNFFLLLDKRCTRYKFRHF